MPVSDETIKFSDSGAGHDPLIGSMVDDYEVKDRVGQGAMGIVYRGVHRIIGKTVAIKVLKLDYADDPDMVNRLVGEARTVNAIRHPGIVDIFGFGTLKTGQPYIVMDMLEGQPLDVFIKLNAPLKLKAAWPILDDILGALGAAHQVGVIHRDLKPGNVFRESHPEARSRIKVIDFGLARTADRAGGSVRPTNPGTLLGTPAFMAPEQVVGTKVTPATDLYALGGIAYQLLTGHLPHEAPSAIEVLSAKMSQDPLPPRHWLPTLDEDVDGWVMALLARDPDARPQAAEDARRTLRRIGEGRTTSNGTAALKRSGSTRSPTPAVKPRGWSDAKTLLVDQQAPEALASQHVTDKDENPFAPTRESPVVRAQHEVPHFGPTPIPQAAHNPSAASVGAHAAVPINKDLNRTVPMLAVAEPTLVTTPAVAPKAKRDIAPARHRAPPARKPTKSIVPLVVAALVLLAMLTVGVLYLNR